MYKADYRHIYGHLNSTNTTNAHTSNPFSKLTTLPKIN